MDNPILIHASLLEGTALGLQRLVKRGRHYMKLSCQHQSVNIRQISRNRAEKLGYYRFLENENVTVSELVQSLSRHCQKNIEGRHILAISDKLLHI
ncbi:MAG: hypothetical protein WCF82_00740 [Microcoleus sp.]